MEEPEPASGSDLRLRVVLLDAGGTLIYMPRTPEEILADLCLQLGFTISLEQAIGACRASEQYYIQHYLGHTGDQGAFWHSYHGAALAYLGIRDPEGERASFLSHGFGRAGIWQAYPESAGACRRLRAMGLALGVISNGSVTVRDLLAQAGLLTYFDIVMASQDLGVEKPDPEIFRTVLGRLGVHAGEVLYVGDLYDVDVVGARGAGIEAVLIDRSGGQHDCPTIRSLDELVPIAQKLSALAARNTLPADS